VELIKKIVLITSGQPSANPRIVKEASALSKAGFIVSLVYAPLSRWADRFDEELFKSLPEIKWIKAGYHYSTERRRYKLVRIRRIFFEVLFKFFPFLSSAAENCIALFAHELKVKATSIEADLYIAHNLAALPAAKEAALKFRSIYAFDAEDFHRGEDKEGSRQWRLATAIERKYLPAASYVSAASPLIEKTYKNLFNELFTFTINNVFTIAYLQPLTPISESGILKMFWFSQTIGKQRGIEDVIKAMGLLDNRKIQLSLLGCISKENKHYFLELMNENNVMEDQVKFFETVKESDLPVIAAKHHIGLALEVPEVISRRLCLTNKIFLYLLAGNAIIFSRTPAQELFLKENEGIGLLFESGVPSELAERISFYTKNTTILHAHRLKALALARQRFNWETESEFFISKIKEVLN
jgi:glycosyltransferase involved in cell wall biosynthesis